MRCRCGRVCCGVREECIDVCKQAADDSGDTWTHVACCETGKVTKNKQTNNININS